MRPIRVLVVDDSVVVRRLVSDVLAEDPMIEVVGTASNGRIAVAQVGELQPDLVTLDIEMPEMDGLEALRAIRATHPRLPIIMFSTLTQLGASATLDALAMGASDYVTKPANVGSITQGMQAIRLELTPKVHALCRRPAGLSRAEAPRPTLAPSAPLNRTGGFAPLRPSLGASRLNPGLLRPPTTEPCEVSGPATALSRPVRPVAPTTPRAHELRPAGRGNRVDLLMIGSSTGGPNALTALWAGLPKDLAVPVIMTQHMPSMFTTLFAERLTRVGTVPVVEGTDGTLLQAGHAVLAPGDHHLVLDPNAPNGRVRITTDAPVNSCRPAVDPMFRSAVKVFGGNVLAVILTGMGSDGLDGCRIVRAAGGQVIAQDEFTSVVWGMPGHVTQAGLADAVLPIERIAAEIVQRVGSGRLASSGLRRAV